MIQSITLGNFKSFGEPVTVPLAPITVLVGPNNSGKSNFLSVGRFVGNAARVGIFEAVDAEGGLEYLLHRPRPQEARLHLEWKTARGRYSMTCFVGDPEGYLVSVGELLEADGQSSERQASSEPFYALRNVYEQQWQPFVTVINPVVESRLAKLSLDAMRLDADVVPKPKLLPNGEGLAAVIGLWRGFYPDKIERLNDFVRRCVEDVRHVLVGPAPEPAKQRLYVEHKNGERFDAQHLSDGLLCFITLAAITIDARPGSIIFLEEPELAVHPPRIPQVMKLLRDVQEERGCQFVIATHSRTLIDQFREEPEAILRFRSTPEGTRAERLSDIPELMEALERRTHPSEPSPGDLIESNLFNAVPPPDAAP